MTLAHGATGLTLDELTEAIRKSFKDELDVDLMIGDGFFRDPEELSEGLFIALDLTDDVESPANRGDGSIDMIATYALSIGYVRLPSDLTGNDMMVLYKDISIIESWLRFKQFADWTDPVGVTDIISFRRSDLPSPNVFQVSFNIGRLMRYDGPRPGFDGLYGGGGPPVETITLNVNKSISLSQQ